MNSPFEDDEKLDYLLIRGFSFFRDGRIASPPSLNSYCLARLPCAFVAPRINCLTASFFAVLPILANSFLSMAAEVIDGLNYPDSLVI